MSKHLMSTREVCDELQISASTLYTWRTAGVAPPALKIGRHLRFPRGAYENWLAERLTTADRIDQAPVRHLRPVD